MLSELSKYHEEWLKIANSFIDDSKDAEDIVQDMYLRLHDKGVTWERIKHNNEPNRYFVYLTIRNLCISFIRQKKVKYEVHCNIPEEPINDDPCELIETINEEVKTWDYYERTIFEIYMYSGLSLRDISNGTTKQARLLAPGRKLSEEAVKRGIGISVTSMFHTIKGCKEKLKNKINGESNTKGTQTAIPQH